MGSVADESKSLEVALARSVDAYTQKHHLSKKSHDKACAYLPGGNTRTVLYTTPFPFTVASGKSCYLTTIEGHEYVDFLGEYTAGIYGHDNPIIRKAIEQALDGGWNYGGHCKMEQELARIVCTRFPAMEKVRFVNSGTEANMMALATSLAFTGKKKVLVFQKGYHGSTISARTVSGKPTINLPHEFIVGTYNDMSVNELVSGLPRDSLAAILVEPMLGSGGCYAAHKEWLQLLRRIADEEKALLVFDEVMTSRLAYNGLHTQYQVKPDLMTLGKWVGGGMSFGAFGGRNEIMQLFDPRTGQLEHPGTFNNNVFSMSAGIAGCNLLSEGRLSELNQLGVSMRQEIEDVLRKHRIDAGMIPESPVTEEMNSASHAERPPKMFIKGVGSLMCVHFAGPDKDSLQALFYHHMLEHGIYLAQRGFIALNLEIQQEHVNKFVGAVDDFCLAWGPKLKWQG